jgi:hypothetical protein
VIHQSDPCEFPSGHCPVTPVSYHVALDTMMGRRSRHRPDEVAIDGFLLLDTGEYELVTAHVPLEVFWKMKTLDIVGQVRTANRTRVARPSPYPQVGSVWLVDGDLKPSASGLADSEEETSSRGTGGAPETVPLADAPDGDEPRTGDPTKRAFRLQVRAVYSLDRVAIEPKGPRFIETLHVRDMLPEFRAD